MSLSCTTRARQRTGRPGFFRPGEKFNFERRKTRPGPEIENTEISKWVPTGLIEKFLQLLAPDSANGHLRQMFFDTKWLSATRNPVRNPDFQILFPETGLKLLAVFFFRYL